jgi:outer membrane protein assembly factor BamB
VGGEKGLCAINATDGKILWNIGGKGENSPAAIANGRIYYSSNNGTIIGLQAK